jgi:cytochrome subunit of sulfide dehydrogenase
VRWKAFSPIVVLVSFCGTATSAAEREPAAMADACASCHGPDGRSEGAIPSLAGMPAAEFVAKMEAFRTGEGEATIMDRIAPGFSPAETRRLADYFANLR